MEILKGQVSIFDLTQDHEKENKVGFTKEQLEVIEKLKRKTDWIEYNLYESGKVLFIEKKDINSKVVPMGDEEKTFYLRAQYLTHCIDREAKIICWLGKDKWDNPVKSIVRESNNEM